MRTVIEEIEQIVRAAFTESGYDGSYAKVTVSNRPDLCEYQCNGAMAAAKAYGKAPFMIADDVVAKLAGNTVFKSIESVKPGFINIKVSDDFLSGFLNNMASSDKFGYVPSVTGKTVIVDYGGANAAKPLHVGHLRSAVIGESVKRIQRYAGNKVIGDVHLGDWGLQMGLIIEELRDRKPELPYFDDSFAGEYPTEAPFTISELEEIYPAASAKSKQDEAFLARAHESTLRLQSGDKACTAIWNHIMAVSKADLKKNYDNLNVSFDLWKGESDAQPYIPDMIQDMVDKGLAYESQGATVVDVQEETDTKELPPCIIRKSDGAALYATSDLATLVEREKDFNPDRYIYLADKRQELHFTQVFRVAKKAGIVKPDAELTFLGFGTMNGADGKPFKTRSGGVMRLENLIADIDSAVLDKMNDNSEKKGQTDIDRDEAEATAKIVGLAALKYGDLSNQASKDYVFDVDRFSSFEGNTGPYILYTIVRIKSIIAKYKAASGDLSDLKINLTGSESEKNLSLALVKFSEVTNSAYSENAPHKICQFIYDVSNAFNGFYHDTKILSEPDEDRKKSYISLISLTRDILLTCIDLLGIQCPERM
jgi:arginyl-tRNA synthetase